MGNILEPRVKETSNTTGTGNLTLLGAVVGFQAFSDVYSNGDPCYYVAEDSSGNWEVGLGAYTSSGNSLARTTVYASSNSGSPVNFGAGTKTVYVSPHKSMFPFRGADVASASALNVGTSGSYFNVTGTTTITSITPVRPKGEHIDLVFAGAVTITHGASTINFPNGQSYTTTAGDIIRFISHDGATTWNAAWIAHASSSGAVPIVAAAGSADAITATYSPALTLADLTLCAFMATAANATTTPTFAPNGLTAHTITKKGGQALAAGDIPGQYAVCLLEYNSAHTRWELLNPANTSAKCVLGSGSLRGVAMPNATTAVAGLYSGLPYGTGGTMLSGSAGNYTVVEQILPYGGTLSNLYVRSGPTYTTAYTWKVYVNGSATALTITTGTGTANTTYSDTTHTVAVSAGDRICLVASNGTALDAQPLTSWSVELDG